MKTQVIQLDRYDDLTAVRDKLSWTKSERILLIYPRRARILSRALDLRLVQRQAAAMGSQLAIVTQLDEIGEAARELGIPVFASAAVAQRRDWEMMLPERPSRQAEPVDLRKMRRETRHSEPGWHNHLGVRLAFFSVAVLAVLVLLALFIPSASLQLTPQTKLETLTVSVNASPNVTAVSLGGSIPARMTFTSIERSKTAPVTGTLTIPAGTAAGMVRFSNLTTGVVGIPSGTVVRSTGNSPVRFATVSDAVVAAGVGKTMDVPVQAVDAGPSGNLPADMLVAIEGDLGTSLAVTNPGPTSGGTQKKAPVQTADDRTALHAALEAEILAECKTALPASLAPGDLYFPDTAKVSQVISESYFPAPDQTGDTLSLTMNLQCQAQYATMDDMNSLAGLALDANIPAGFEPIPGFTSGVAAVTGSTQTDQDGTTRWELKAERLLQARLDPLEAVELAQGRRPADAVVRLYQSMPLEISPRLLLTPAWWPWLPVVPFRISVHIARPAIASE
ncbi:MAG TPA: baseplate J/gp47 family protein [Anaerolineales bacterium]|nr:baseplate J/gp47 family protein [Anaerolineales bacterium]